MSIRARIQSLAERINGLSLRERGLLFLAILAVIFLLWDLAVMRPIESRRQATQAQLEQVRDRVDQLSSSIQTMIRERNRDPNAELTARANALEEQIEELKKRISQLHGGVSDPRNAIDVLATLLDERPGLRLVSLENMPPEPLLAGDPAGGGGIFIHRVQLVVEADFGGVLEYMGLVERLPAGVYWESLELDVPEWPTNRVEMVLYSVALDDGWVGT